MIQAKNTFMTAKRVNIVKRYYPIIIYIDFENEILIEKRAQDY